MPPGIPQSFFVPYYIQIVQAPKHIVIAHEYSEPASHHSDRRPSASTRSGSELDGKRRRPLGRRHAGHRLDRLQRQDGDQRLPSHGVAARRRALSAVPMSNTLQYEATIEDPNVFAGPWVIKRTFPLLPEYDRSTSSCARTTATTSRCSATSEARVSRDAEEVFRVAGSVAAVRAGAVRARRVHPHDRGA